MAQEFPTTIADFQENLAEVHERIAAACALAGRDVATVRLLPVSKTVPEDRLLNAIAAGITRFGENKAQEVKRKAQALATTDVEWAVIGHLQTNKAKEVAQYATEFQALDSERIATALHNRLEMLNRTLEVYVQVNTSAEEAKFGLEPAEVPAFLDILPQFPRLQMRGFMTLAMFSSDTSKVRSCFELLRDIRDQAAASHGEIIGAGELSMGMSGDYELAIQEGANCVRVGQAIFGARNYAAV